MFQPKAAREAFELLAGEADISLRAKVLCSTYSSEFFEADFAFMQEYSRDLPLDLFAAIGRLLYKSRKQDFINRLNSADDVRLKVKFLSTVYASASDEMLFRILESPATGEDVKIQCVNALTSLPLMQVESGEWVQRIGKRLAAMTQTESSLVVNGRVVRALGQIRYVGPEAITILKN